MGVVAVSASRVATTTQVYPDSVPCSWLMMVGRALVTTVEDNIATNMPISRPDSDCSIWRCVMVVTSPAGAAVAPEAAAAAGADAAARLRSGVSRWEWGLVVVIVIRSVSAWFGQ